MAESNSNGNAALGAGLVLALMLCSLEGKAMTGILWLVGIFAGLPLLWIFVVSRTFEDTTQRVLIMVAAAALISALALF